MRILKSLTLSVVLGAATLIATVPATPVSAMATPMSVQDLIDTRQAQLQAVIAAAQAVLGNPASTPAERNQAQAELQVAFFRNIQLLQLEPAVPGLPQPALDALEAFLQNEISNA